MDAQQTQPSLQNPTISEKHSMSGVCGGLPTKSRYIKRSNDTGDNKKYPTYSCPGTCVELGPMIRVKVTNFKRSLRHRPNRKPIRRVCTRHRRRIEHKTTAKQPKAPRQEVHRMAAVPTYRGTMPTAKNSSR